MSDAKITIGADASAAERALSSLKQAGRDAAESLKSEIGGAARSVVTSLGEVALAQGRVNFSAQHAQVREFEGATARLAVSAGRDLESVRASIERTGLEIGKRPQDVVKWTDAVGRLTYSFAGAEQSMKGFAGLAAMTGRSVDDYRDLAVTLGTVGGVAGNSSHALGVMVEQANELGTVGGPAAFADQISGLREVISHFATSADGDFARVTAVAGVLGGKLNPVLAGRAQQDILGKITGNTLGYERLVGHRITDENGQVTATGMIDALEASQHDFKKWGAAGNREARFNFGDVGGARLMQLKKGDFDEMRRLAQVSPSSSPEEALKKFLGTDAGKRNQAESELAVSSRALMGSSTALGKAADALQRFAAHNPISSTFGATLGGGLLSGGLKTVGNLVGGGSLKNGGLLGAAGKAGGGIVGKLGLVGMAAGAGMALGEAINDAWADQFFTDQQNAGARADFIQGQNDPAKDAALNTRVGAIRRSNAALRNAWGAKDHSGLSSEDMDAARAATNAAVQSNAAVSGGGDAAIPALVAQLKALGKDDVNAERIAKAIAAELRAAPQQVNVVNQTGGPVVAVSNGKVSAAAGGQH
jgi:hypothetical protein